MRTARILRLKEFEDFEPIGDISALRQRETEILDEMPLRPECPVCRSILKENGQVLDIGLRLESVIVAANRSIQGLIATS